MVKHKEQLLYFMCSGPRRVVGPRLVDVLDELASVANARLAFNDELPRAYRAKVGFEEQQVQ